jgi:hypothetical protein
MSKEKTDDFVVWTLKPDYDNAIITESDIGYYKKMKNIDRTASVVLKQSDGTLRDVFWAE